MNKIKVFCDWNLEINLYHQKNIELYVNLFPNSPKDENTVRFVLLIEPPEIVDFNNVAIQSYSSNYYDYLLTHQDNLLESIKDSFLFEFGTCWIKEYTFPEKEFSVSTLIGGKNMTTGHKLRHDLVINQDKITGIKTIFYNSKNRSHKFNEHNPYLEGDKSELFNSQFHICIENCKRDNWFTEKLIDCFQTKSIPIYYGCPNIDKWFNPNGMILVDTVDDIINVCNSLDVNKYQSMLPYIEENFEKSKEFINYTKRIEDKIKEILENENIDSNSNV